MKGRCKPGGHPRYSGRGIRVCDEWSRSFAAFYAHVGPRPSSDYSIDRIDNDGNYEPGNVRWATSYQQSRNKTHNGGRSPAPRMFDLSHRQRLRRALSWRLWMEEIPNNAQGRALFGAATLGIAKTDVVEYFGYTERHSHRGWLRWPTDEQTFPSPSRLSVLRGRLRRCLDQRALSVEVEAKIRAELDEREGR
jgi:hypothetical protein